MTITQHDGERKGYFLAEEDGKEAGRMTYSHAGDDKIIIDHTEVNPEFSGRGVGKLMVLEAVKVARDNQLKIVPLCPFAKSVFDKHPDLGDVLF